MNLFKKNVLFALSVLSINCVTAKNFDISQPRLVDSLSDIRPVSVFFNTVNGQNLGYMANDVLPGSVIVFSPPLKIQGEFALPRSRGMVFNSADLTPYLYASSPGDNNVYITELDGFSGQIVGSISFTGVTPEYFVEKKVDGKDYSFLVTYANPGYVASLELTGSTTQVVGSISIGVESYYGAFNPINDNFLYVPNTGDSTLSVVELSGSVFLSSTPLTLGGTPNDICFGQFPEGVYGYVANQASGMNILSINGGSVTVVGTVSDQGPLLSISSQTINDNQYAYAYAGNNLYVYELQPGTCTLLNSLPTPNSNTLVSKMSYTTVGQNTYGYLPLPGPNVLQVYLLYQNPFQNYSGNAGVVSGILNEINNDGCLPSTQAMIEYLFLQDDPPLQSYISQLAPAFKIAQYSLEKLDYVLHKQFDTKLYQESMDNDIFIMTGYDHMSQQGTSKYNRYNVDNFFQFIGGNYHFKDMKAIAAIGASESYLKVHPQNAHAKYPTVWGALGLMGKVSNWTFGIDGLFGYSFLQTSRKISFLNQKAHSSHNAWNISFEGKVSYTKEDDNVLFKPYDTFGYIYGHEANYQEHGTNGANLKVKDENLSVFRNALGIEFDAPKDTCVKAIFDLAWVWDYYFSNTSYKAAFVGTDSYGTFKTVQPARSYGRANLGLEGSHNHFEWKLFYTGLYGKRFSENTGTLELGYRF